MPVFFVDAEAFRAWLQRHKDAVDPWLSRHPAAQQRPGTVGVDGSKGWLRMLGLALAALAGWLFLSSQA